MVICRPRQLCPPQPRRHRLYLLLPSPSSFQKTGPLYSADFGNASLKKRVEDVMSIATGNEWDEIEADLEERKIFVGMEAPVGPLGTKVGGSDSFGF